MMALIGLYADLAQAGQRVLEPEDGKILVPAFLREQVRQELVARGVIEA